MPADDSLEIGSLMFHEKKTIFSCAAAVKVALALCLLGNYSYFLSSADFFQKLTFSQNSHRNTIRESNCLGPDPSPELFAKVISSRHSVGNGLRVK